MKDKVINFFKFFLLIFVMTMGFFMIYALAWFVIGLPQTDWAIALLFAIAGLSEYGYYRWIREG